MKNSILKIAAIACLFSFTIACNDKAANGNVSEAGTQTYDQRPHQNEPSTSSDVDTITSPGSNVQDIKDGTTPAAE